MYNVYKGTWWRANKFETEDKQMIQIYPHGQTREKYEKKFPFDCYIMLDEFKVVKEVVEV